MIKKRSWFQRPLAAIFLLMGAVVLSAFLLMNSDGHRDNSGEINYRITLRHYGSDIHEMERTAAIPLEDALSAIPGIDSIVTVSENNQARAFVSFRRGQNDGYYDAVREAAQRVYEALPSSAQRPEIIAAGDFRIPFFTAAVYGTEPGDSGTKPDGWLLEKVIKPALGSIEGIAEVEIAGPGIMEIHVVLDQEKIAAMGLNPGVISSVLASNDGVFSAGNLYHGGLEIPVRVDGRYAEPGGGALGEALIPLASGIMVRLSEIAEVREEERQADTLTRLNGKKTAIVSLTAVSGADIGHLSGKIRNAINGFSSLPLEFHILEDRGAEEAAAFRSILRAAMESSILLALAVILLGLGKSAGLRRGLICAGTIPLILLISAAVLSAAGFTINRSFLAGLSVGIGGAVDAVILCSEGFSRAGISRGKNALRRIWPPLAAGAVTTVAALLPLAGISGGGDITVIAFAIGTVTIVSVVLALTLLPPLLLWEKNTDVKNIKIKNNKVEIIKIGTIKIGTIIDLGKKLLYSHALPVRRYFFRIFAVLLRFNIKRSVAFPVMALLITLAAIFALVSAGTDTAGDWASDSVYVQIEFEGGFLKDEADLLLAAWAENIKDHSSVTEVQTGARTGSGYGFVTFDPGKSNIIEIRNIIRTIDIPGAFIFIPEPSPADRIWTVTVSGDDTEKCRELTTEAAFICSYLPEIKESVLNFKQGGPRLTLRPGRELLAHAGMSFSFPAETVRQGVQGPVAYKRIGENGETDLRIMFASMNNGEDVLNIPLAGNSVIRSLMEIERNQDISSIQRINRRRAASFSIRTNPGDPRYFRDIVMGAVNDLDLPPGYRIDFDPEAISSAEALSMKLLNFIWAVIFCYMVIAAIEESFILPLIILSSVPPSLAAPVLILCMQGAPVNTAVACALVAVSGMAVNASVISAGELWRRSQVGLFSFYSVLRGRIPVLLATTGTTIMGSLPFLFLGEGNNAFVRTLAMVSIIGVGISLFFSLTLVPSLINLYFSFRKKRKTCSAWAEQN